MKLPFEARVAFQGERGAFSEEAALKLAGPDITLIPRATFEKAFSAIADSNITTLIAGVVLWVFGAGPIRGFAIVLTLGIATSMFTSLMGSRALITLMYGGRRKLARLPI